MLPRIILTFILFYIYQVQITSAKEVNITYEYKKYEVVDLGKLEIEGEVTVPSDISIRDTKTIEFNNLIFKKINFKKEQRNEIRNFR